MCSKIDNLIKRVESILLTEKEKLLKYILKMCNFLKEQNQRLLTELTNIKLTLDEIKTEYDKLRKEYEDLTIENAKLGSYDTIIFVASSNLFMFYLGWEGVGLVSLFLISF